MLSPGQHNPFRLATAQTFLVPSPPFLFLFFFLYINESITFHIISGQALDVYTRLTVVSRELHCGQAEAAGLATEADITQYYHPQTRDHHPAEVNF